MVDSPGVVEQLHASLDSRLSPEAVAGLVRTALAGRLTAEQDALLARASAPRYPWLGTHYSSMSSEFERPVPVDHKLRMLAVMLADGDVDQAALDAAAAIADDPWAVRLQIQVLAPFVGWDPAVPFHKRMNRQARKAAGVRLSGRRYDRVVRHLNRLNARLDAFERHFMLRQLLLVGRSGLAAQINAGEMGADVDAACFVAYWVANRNRRTVFTTAGRDNPMDEVAAMLLDRCVARGGFTDWWMIARAYPAPVIVARLDDGRRGELMGRWSWFMGLASNQLRELHAQWPVSGPSMPDEVWEGRPGLMPTPEERGAGRPLIDRATMVVRPGVDSSTWNTLAQAYNTARAGWINCLGAAGALEVLDVVCPPKVMRLMAADVQMMHGGGAHPDTAVWATLPLPWEVLDGDAECTRETVELACRQHGVDPHAAGWTAPRQTGAVAAWKPTPELVHGVEVGDPVLAGLLRRAGVFAGRKSSPAATAGYLSDTGEHHAGVTLAEPQSAGEAGGSQ
ncbi:hypothetical protein AB0F93_03435 [Micromonospora tulbaghiae]|uniref:hypothetical protein n=1 Tax=Micromonospora tulbaghiae TaxID=479978 RepID=UPI00332BF43D